MTYTAENPLKTWDFQASLDAGTFSEYHSDFWRTINALPVGSIIANGYADEGLVYFEKHAEGFSWEVVQCDNEAIDDEDWAQPGYIETSDPAVIDAGGDIDFAYLLRRGPA